MWSALAVIEPKPEIILGEDAAGLPEDLDPRSEPYDEQGYTSQNTVLLLLSSRQHVLSPREEVIQDLLA